MKNIMSKTYRFPQTTCGNLCGSNSKKILSNSTKVISYKLTALVWELRRPSLSLSFLWQTLKRDYFRLTLFNLFIDDICLLSRWEIPMKEVTDFVNFANSFYPTIKFTCEMSSDRTVFLDTEVFKGPRLTTL